MKSLSSIQNQVRIFASDSTFVLTNNSNAKMQGLNIANRIYRKLANLEEWPELLRADTSISIVSGTSEYAVPSTPKFLNIKKIEVQNELGSYYVVPEVKTELDWSYFAAKTSLYPSVYQLRSGNIYFSPTPGASSQVRITGTIEPDEFTSGDTQTVFYSSILDDALEYLIASEILFTDGLIQEGLLLVQKASSILTKYSGREIRPDEIDPRAKEAA